MKNKLYATGNRLRSILLTLPMILIILLMLSGGQNVFADSVHGLAYLVTVIFYGTMFFMMHYKGEADKWRAIAFFASAVLFSVTFMSNLVEMRGSTTYSESEIMSCEIPFCHIVTTMVIIPAAIKQTIIFPGSILTGFASISSMLVIVLGAGLILGRGFCSWGCFYGGWDDGFHRIGKKTWITRINESYRYFALAMLIVMALWSASTLMPEYCNWLCPFKLVTERDKVVDAESLIKTIIMVVLFVALVVVLPILTKKRVQCATFCPMGALMSIFNKVCIFSVRNNRSKCIDCGKCRKVCPMLAIDQKHQPLINCSMCGKCVDACPTGAMQYHIKGTAMGKKITTVRTLFLYPAYAFMVTLTGGSVVNAIELIIKWIL